MYGIFFIDYSSFVNISWIFLLDLCNFFSILELEFIGLVWFGFLVNGISTFVGYLMPKPFS